MAGRLGYAHDGYLAGAYGESVLDVWDQRTECAVIDTREEEGKATADELVIWNLGRRRALRCLFSCFERRRILLGGLLLLSPMACGRLEFYALL